MYKLRTTFSKSKNMIYISHLDVMRSFMRALRRAKLPFFLSKGFSPRPKISFKKALSLGKESFSEEASFHLTEKIKEAEFIKRFNRELPEGISIEDAIYES